MHALKLLTRNEHTEIVEAEVWEIYQEWEEAFGYSPYLKIFHEGKTKFLEGEISSLKKVNSLAQKF